MIYYYVMGIAIVAFLVTAGIIYVRQNRTRK